MSNISEKSINNEEFDFVIEQFADLRVLRYQVPDFNNLSLNQKKLLYFLGEAAQCGRDIFWDQNGKYNLAIRQLLEGIYLGFKGGKQEDEWKAFEEFIKRVWFSNGIHHHYSCDKFQPGFSRTYFETLLINTPNEGFPQFTGKSKQETIEFLTELIFNPEIQPKKVSQDESKDIVKSSAVNFYDGVTKQEVEDFYGSTRNENDEKPISHGLNSKLVKEDGVVKEAVWQVDSMYSEAIKKIVYWLQKAVDCAESELQKRCIELLIEYYNTGSLKIWDDYNIQWVKDTSALVDFVNGFIEVYDDPLGMKATWEALVNFKNLEATKRTEIISDNAQWFEDNSPIEDRFKKEEVKGVTAKVINTTMLGGACYPHTPIGINLPNSNWIREIHGSKSVTIENITYAYNQANLKSGFLEEFAATNEEIALIKKYGSIADNLHTDLHECLGHGSGKMLPGVSNEVLENYHSALEETRADLFALYYMMDDKMIELGLMESLDVAKVHYISYLRNGLMTQLKRIEPGKNIEQAHMRNRQLISKWCYEQGKADNVIELEKVEGKTFIKINDYKKLRDLFAILLKEVQRIKSEGDYTAGKALVEDYGVKVEVDIHKEVLQRFEKLNMAAYNGFVNPRYKPITKGDEIIDVQVDYSEGFAEQMLRYGKDYAFLAIEN